MQVTIDSPEYDTYDFIIKHESVEPSLDVTLEDNNGDPVDLTGASVEFRMRAPGADTKQVDDSVLITDATAGEIAYQWSESDTEETGDFNAEFAVDYSGDTGSDFDADEYFPSDDYVNIRVMETL